jgi:hypothetical protein
MCFEVEMEVCLHFLAHTYGKMDENQPDLDRTMVLMSMVKRYPYCQIFC